MDSLRALALLVLVVTAIAPVKASTASVTSVPSVNAVTVDGKWTTTNEWSEAQPMRMQMMDSMGRMMASANPGAFRVKHDQTFMYIMMEAMDDQGMERDDMGCVTVDRDHSGGTAPQQSTFKFCVQMMNQTAHRSFMYQGTGTGWSGEMTPPLGFMGAMSISSAADMPNPHAIYEFRIPRSVLGGSMTIGALMSAYDKGADRWGVWPSSSNMNAPASMGDMMMGDNPMGQRPIPGFPVESIMAGLAIALAGLVLRSRRRNRCERGSPPYI